MARAPVGVLTLAVLCIVGCASPPPGDSSLAASSPAAAPRFAASGPNAADHGEHVGCPMGDRATFWEVPNIVGSFSHQARLVMVHTAVRKQSVDPQLPEATALWRGVVRALES